MEETAILDVVRAKFDRLRPLMDERMRRQWAASEALSLKRGGVTVVARATGLSRSTIGQGMRELRERANLGIEDETCVWEVPPRIRRPGGGRHPRKANDPTLVRDLEALIEPSSVAIRNLRCAGPARALGTSPRRCLGTGIGSVTKPWRS